MSNPTRVIPLTELEPEWIHEYNEGTMRYSSALTPATAQGLLFLCPVCFEKNKGDIGTHSVLTWFKDRGVPDEARPNPGRWTVSGNDFTDLTLTPSIFLTGGGCGWHGFITNGQVT